MKKLRTQSAIILAFLAAFAVACVLLFPYIVRFSELFHNATGLPVCLVNDYFDIRCPLCGGTRCAAALMDFDILKSLYYNPFVVVFGVCAFIWYVLMAVGLLSGRRESIKINNKALRIILIAVILFTVVRNTPFYRVFLY